VDDYPRIESRAAQSFGLPVNVFKKLLNKTAFCMSQEVARESKRRILRFQAVPDGVM
jgi:DNA polymerase III sliding clamp (beta) subunit (PCNA family)